MTPATPSLTKDMQMQDILKAFPSARRALFTKYHVGGCSSCGFQDTDTLEQVCRSHNLSDVDGVVAHLLKSHEVDQRIQVPVREAAEALKKDPRVKLIDVRTEEEYATAKLPGALLVNSDETVQTVMGWPKDTPILVLCHHGMRSLDAASYLIGHGFTDVRSVTGGIDAWSAEVDPSIPRY